jgi:hypothetical protein
VIDRGVLAISSLGGSFLLGRKLDPEPTVFEFKRQSNVPVNLFWFQSMDRDSDGSLTWDEFLGPRKPFESLDSDGDGRLSREEAEKANGSDAVPQGSREEAAAVLKRLAGDWRLASTNQPQTNKDEPVRDEEIYTFSEQSFSTRRNGKPAESGALEIDLSVWPPRLLLRIRDETGFTGGHIDALFEFKSNDELWLAVPDTSVRTNEAVLARPRVIWKLKRMNVTSDNAARVPTTADSDLVTPRELLVFKPDQPGIEYDEPDENEIDACRVVLEPGAAWSLLSRDGVLLRRFEDTNRDGKVDSWRYYKSDKEVYRDVDTDHDGRVDRHETRKSFSPRGAWLDRRERIATGNEIAVPALYWA